MPVEIPVPPSANHLWRSITRRTRSGGSKTFVVMSKQYKSWLEEAVLLLKCGLSKPTSYPVCIRITIHGGKGWRCDRDLDNATKGVVDAVKHAGRIVDDSTTYVTRIELEYRPPESKKSQSRCVVELLERS